MKRYPHVLWLTIALCLASCSSQRQIICGETENSLNKDVQTRLDSIVRQTAQVEIDRLVNRTDDVKTDIILFDTDKPASDSTGLPPVKAVVRQQAISRELAEEKVRGEVQTDADVRQEISDHSQEVETTSETSEEKPSFVEALKRHLQRILLIPVLFIAIRLLYKLIKFVRNGN